MRKVFNGVYVHRGVMILENKDGWVVDDCLHIFKALIDAKEYINKFLDGTNTREPRIVREWMLEEDYQV